MNTSSTLRRSLQGIAVFAAAAMAANAAAAAPSQVIRLSAQEQQRLHIEAAPLARGEQPQVARGFAQILDAASFVALAADRKGAAAAAKSSGAEARRLELLQADEDNASLKNAQAARAQATADQARARALAARIALEWSPALARSASGLVQRLAGGRASLVRIEFAAGIALENGTAVELTVPGSDAGLHWTGHVLGPAGGVQVIGPGSAFLVEAPASGALHVGQRLIAMASVGDARRGAVIPAAAIVTFESRRWCYEQTVPEGFVRRAVPADALSIPQGALVRADFTSHPVVIHGASALLSVERAASGASSD